jgi:hypothetical protein
MRNRDYYNKIYEEPIDPYTSIEEDEDFYDYKNESDDFLDYQKSDVIWAWP